MEKVKENKTVIVKVLLFVALVIAVVTMVLEYEPYLTKLAKNPAKIRAYLNSAGWLGFLIYILMQVAHVLIVVIPGDLITVCGGYLYGVPIGFVLSMIGVLLGASLAFGVSRFLGYEFITKFISYEKIEKMNQLLNSNKGTIGLFVICLTPFIPKDIFIYMAGLTPIKLSKLLSVYGVSLIPSTLIWSSVGANMYKYNVASVIFTLVILGILLMGAFVLQQYYKKKRIGQ